MTKIKNRFSEQSQEYKYITDLISFCKEQGVVRFEQKIKPRYIQKHKLNYWGLSDYSVLHKLHSDFLDLDKKLSVNAMDFETISDHLVSSGVVETTRAANTTAMYAIQWFHGHIFDFNKKAVQTHRARLRKIGIDIAQKCNVSKFSPVIVKQTREIKVKEGVAPSWYVRPSHLRVA